MKITGIILTIIGLIGGAICVYLLVQPLGDNPEVADRGTQEAGIPGMLIPLAICAGAVTAGLLMLMFGGRGYIISYNPRVRN